MGDKSDSTRPAGVCIGWAAAIVLAGVTDVAIAEEPCEPGEGLFPPDCPYATKIVVCANGRIVVDDYKQRETSIAAVADGCKLTLAGFWIDKAQYVAVSGSEHLALSLSNDGGRHWYRAGGDFPPCDQTLEGDPRRFLNDCFFAGCLYDPDPPECDLLPNDCTGYDWDPGISTAAEPWVCAGGNGNLYFIGADRPTGIENVQYAVLFSRSPDRGESWGPFTCCWDGQQEDRRLKHICEELEYDPPVPDEYGVLHDLFDPDRTGIAASPNPTSDRVYVYWNASHHGQIWCMQSDDQGESWLPSRVSILHEVVHVGEDREEIHAPGAVVDDEDTLYIAWAHLNDISRPDVPMQIRFRRFNEQMGWDPPLHESPRSLPDEDDEEVTFNGCQLGGCAYAERSVPSIAVDCCESPYDGWVYVVYADHSEPEAPYDYSRIKFQRSCDSGVQWDDPVAISPDPVHVDSIQFYPRVRVDGRGNIGVSWYDTRFRGIGANPEYDIFFAYSDDGGATWRERRVSGFGDEPGFFDPNLPDPPQDPDDYSGMTADPRSGYAKFYILAMGTQADPPQDNQDVFSYEVSLRPAGDLDGDFDVDQYDNDFARCFGLTYPDCECAALDFDDDGDVDRQDMGAFQNAWTGTRCDCHGPCQDDPACGGEGDGMSGDGWDEESLAELPEACDLAVWYAMHSTPDQLKALTLTLVQHLAEHADDPDAEAIAQFVECLYDIQE